MIMIRYENGKTVDQVFISQPSDIFAATDANLLNGVCIGNN